MPSNEHESTALQTTAQASCRGDFWQYVPDPSRTVVYVLIAVAVFAAGQWVPQFAGDMEATRLQQRNRDCRERLALQHEQWRAAYPQYAQWFDEQLAQAEQQADQDAEAELKLARPSNPMSIGSESTMPPAWN
jgi:hypothetical protein